MHPKVSAQALRAVKSGNILNLNHQPNGAGRANTVDRLQQLHIRMVVKLCNQVGLLPVNLALQLQDLFGSVFYKELPLIRTVCLRCKKEIKHRSALC